MQIMATIQTRRTADGKIGYRVMVRLKGFTPQSATFSTRTDAKNWGAKVERDLKDGRHFGQSNRHIFSDLAKKYLEAAASLRSFKDRKRAIDFWAKEFGHDTLKNITAQRIAAVRDRLLSEQTNRFQTPATGDAKLDAKRARAKRTGATVNRFLAALSACLNYGLKDLGWLDKNPCSSISKPSEAKGRARFLSDEESTALLAACKPHADLYLAVVLSLTTGARQGEVMSLRWGQIDFKRQIITLHSTKNGERRALPLVGEALQLLEARCKVRNLKDDRIFPPSQRARKKQYLDLRAPWEAALSKAGISDFHWHDLRHTAASYLAMSGVSLVEIAKVLGHRTLAMVARYSHLSDAHIVDTGHKLAARLGVAGSGGALPASA